MWSPKSVNKIFPSQRNTNQNFWSPIFLLRIRTIFPLTSNIKYKHTYILYRRKTMTNESNVSLIHSFVRLPNVSGHFCTFSCLYLLEKKCSRLKNCCLVLCSMFKTISPFAFYQDIWRILILLAPGHNCAAFLVPVPWTSTECWVLHSRLMTHITERKMLFSHWS